MFWALSIAGAVVALLVVLLLVLAIYGRTIPVARTTAVEVDLRKSPQEVYALISDVAGFVRWAPDVRSIKQEPSHDGKPAYTMRIDRQNMFFSVTAAEPPKTFALTIRGNKICSSSWCWDITPTPAGCTVRLTECGEVYISIIRAMLRVCNMEAKHLTSNLAAMAKHLGEDPAVRRLA